jgi:type VI secretion system secreted protein Hcp
MAVFLKLDGIEGESTDARHAKEIDVAAWSLGVTNSGSTHSGGGGGAGRATFTDLAVSKLLDKASPALMLAVATGRHLRSGRLTVTSGGPRPLEYLIVDLEDIRVTSCLLADAADPERPTENVALAYGKIHVAYTQQSPTGGLGAVSELTWDLVHHTPG